MTYIVQCTSLYDTVKCKGSDYMPVLTTYLCLFCVYYKVERKKRQGLERTHAKRLRTIRLYQRSGLRRVRDIKCRGRGRCEVEDEHHLTNANRHRRVASLVTSAILV
jgi:hypothetical protein